MDASSISTNQLIEDKSCQEDSGFR